MCLHHCFRVAFGVSCPRRILPRWIVVSSMISAALATSSSVLATSGTWSSTAVNGGWLVGGNWFSGNIPGATSGTTNTDTATFNNAGNGQTNIANDANRNLQNITFDTSAAAYTIGTPGGNALLLTSGGTTQIASTFAGSDIFETINAPMALEGNYTFAVNTTNVFDILFANGAISSGAVGTQTLTFGGSGTIDADGAIGGGFGTIAIVKNGSGQVGLNTPNTFTGGLTINAGNIFLQSAGALNSTTPNAVTFGPGSTGSLSLFNNSVTVSGLSSSGGTPIVDNGGVVAATLTVNSTVNNTYGGVLQDGGNKSLSLVKSGFGTLTLSGTGTYTGSTTINSNAILQGGATNALSAASGFNVLSFGTLNLGGFAQTIGSLAGSGNVRTTGNAGGDTFTVGNDNTDTIFSGVIFDSGSGRSLALTKIGGGTLTLSGNNTFTGVVNINGGTLALSGGALVPNVINSATFVYNSGSFGGRLTNLGTATFNTAFVPGNGMENDGTASNAAGVNLTLGGAGLTNQGSLSMTGGILTVGSSGTNVNGGSLSLASPARLNLTGAALSNFGMLSLDGGSVSGAGGTLANFPGGTIFGTGTISTAFGNSGGTLIVGGGPMNIVPAFSNSGLIQLTAINSNLIGGTITNAGAGTIQGIGVVSNAVTNSGTIESIGGTLSISGFLSNPGGLLTVDAGSKLFVTNGLVSNAGIINLTGGTFDNAGHPLGNSLIGQISGWGIFRTGGTGLDNNGTITFTGGTTTVNGPVTNENGKTVTIAQNPAIFTGLVTNNVGGTFNAVNTTATFAGGFTNNGNSNFVKAGGGVVEIDVAPTLNNGSTLSVATGMLRFNVVSGSATVGTGVTATVSSGATLELAGSVSALASGSNRVNIVNNSAALGVLVSGTHQQVGGIDGAGTTQVNAGSDLTANHIVQSALVIGGTSKNPGLVTIDASDAAGNPLDAAHSGSLSQPSLFSGDEGLSSAVAPSGPPRAASSGSVNAGMQNSVGLLPDLASAVNAASGSVSQSDAIDGGGSGSAVPEPAPLVLVALGGIASLAPAFRRRAAGSRVVCVLHKRSARKRRHA